MCVDKKHKKALSLESALPSPSAFPYSKVNVHIYSSLLYRAPFLAAHFSRTQAIELAIWHKRTSGRHRVSCDVAERLNAAVLNVLRVYDA